MFESIPTWVVLVPITFVFLVMTLLLRYTATRTRGRTQLAGLAGFLLIYAATNFGPIASMIRLGNDYQRVAEGDQVVRLIPFLQLDTRLILTPWIPDQLLIGFAAFLPAVVFFQLRLRTIFWIIFTVVALGVEINEGWANMSGLTPPFRIDIHDVALRGLGVLAAAIVVQRSRQARIDRDLRRRRASAAPVAHAATQAPSAVLMIRPRTFQPNPETAADNAFQSAGVVDVAERQSVAAQAQIEVAAVATALRGEGVGVVLFDDREGIDTPDSVFPNNWISTHDDGRVVLYPMAAPSRRRERRGDVVEGLRDRYAVSQVLDLSPVELEGRYLEGTGALVLDHVHRIAYMARSGRANEAVLDQWCEAMGYTAEVFDTVDQAGQPIYHTNVVLSIATNFVVAGLSNIPDPLERARIAARLGETGRDVIEIDRGQVAEFAGNGLELSGSRGRLFALSSRALAALHPDQIAAIETSARILAISIPTIERSGGSVRCMLAGIHLPPRQPDAPTTPAA
jgi:hypothetical protein